MLKWGEFFRFCIFFVVEAKFKHTKKARSTTSEGWGFLQFVKSMINRAGVWEPDVNYVTKNTAGLLLQLRPLCSFSVLLATSDCSLGQGRPM